MKADFVSTHRKKALNYNKQHEKWRSFMTDHERSISGLPANDYRVEFERANGSSGRDFDVYDGAVIPRNDESLAAYYKVEEEMDRQVQAYIYQQSLHDLSVSMEFPLEDPMFRTLGASALSREAQLV